MCSSHGKRECLWFPVQPALDCQAERPVWNKQALPLPGRIFGEPGGTEGSVCGVRKVPPLLTVYHVGCLHLISTALLSWTFVLSFSFLRNPSQPLTSSIIEDEDNHELLTWFTSNGEMLPINCCFGFSV